MLFCSNDGTIQRLLLLLNSNILKKRCFIWWKLRSYIFYVQKIVFAQCECMCNAIFFCLFRLNKMKRHSKENSKACSCTNQIFNIEKIEMCTFGWTYSRITIQQILIFCYSFVTICFFLLFVLKFPQLVIDVYHMRACQKLRKRYLNSLLFALIFWRIFFYFVPRYRLWCFCIFSENTKKLLFFRILLFSMNMRWYTETHNEVWWWAYIWLDKNSIVAWQRKEKQEVKMKKKPEKKNEMKCRWSRRADTKICLIHFFFFCFRN